MDTETAGAAAPLASDAIEAEFDALPQPPGAHGDAAALLEQGIDEACLLHASRQSDAAADLLEAAVARATGAAREPLAWQMLFELASFSGNRPRFDALALHYAERFEASPPPWRTPPPAALLGALPVLPIRGPLTGANSSAVLAPFARQAGAGFRLELDGITDIDAAGAGALLALLQGWNAAQRDIRLLPAPQLLALLQCCVQQGRRDQDDACWRLLIELLRISGDANAYEEACLAYSLTYEMSPPAPLLQAVGARRPQHGLPLPVEIGCPVDTLLVTLQAQAATDGRLLLDCRALQRIELAAAAPLLEGIARLAQGKPVEWRDIPVIVWTLLQLVGGGDSLKAKHSPP